MNVYVVKQLFHQEEGDVEGITVCSSERAAEKALVNIMYDCLDDDGDDAAETKAKIQTARTRKDAIEIFETYVEWSQEIWIGEEEVHEDADMVLKPDWIGEEDDE